MINVQMELGMNSGKICVSLKRGDLRRRRAQWWFERMRNLVDKATDWEPAPMPRPEQTWFPEPRR